MIKLSVSSNAEKWPTTTGWITLSLTGMINAKCQTKYNTMNIEKDKTYVVKSNKQFHKVRVHSVGTRFASVNFAGNPGDRLESLPLPGQSELVEWVKEVQQ